MNLQCVDFPWVNGFSRGFAPHRHEFESPPCELPDARGWQVLQFSGLSIMERRKEKDEIYSCEIKLRENPQRQKEKVYIGCGAGFRGDRPLAALKLLQRVKELDYLVLECLAERTLADHYQVMMKGGKGFDPQISDWMSLLLPLAVERGVCLITNMGAMDPHGAQVAVLDVASSLGLDITVSVAYEVALTKSGSTSSHERSIRREGVRICLESRQVVSLHNEVLFQDSVGQQR